MRAIWALAALLSAFACGSSSETSVAPSPLQRCAVQGQIESSSFPASGGSGTLRISTARECSWSVQREAGWLVLPPEARGQGEGSVPFTVTANGEPASRTAGLIVNDQRMPISQEGRPCEFRLSSIHETVDGSGGQRTVRVEASSAQCGWSAIADVSWITLVEGRTGTGSGNVVFEVAPAAGPIRTGTLTIAGQTVTIRQGSDCTYATGVMTISMSPSGGRAEVPVLAPPGCGWSATAQAPWIVIIGGQTGAGNGAVVFHVEASDGPPRTGSLTIAGQSVRIEQGSGCTYATGVTALNVSASGGVLDVPVLAPPGCAWTAESRAAWIAIAGGANGSGAGVARVSVTATDGPLRSGTVTVAGVNVTITQASGCRVSVEPSSYAAPAAGGTSSVTVQTGTGCAWAGASSAAWISLSPTSGSGPAQVPLIVAANDGPQRSGTITIAGRTVAVSQVSRCTWTLVPPSVDYDANGGRGSVLVIVAGGCTWTAASTVSWITMETGESGAGDGLVQFIVAPNSGPARSGAVRIAGIDLLVRQAAR